MKKYVSENAMKARIRRKLAHDSMALVVNRSERAREDLGEYMVVDLTRNTPEVWGMSVYDLVDYGLQIGALHPYEQVEFRDGTTVECEAVAQ